MRILVVQESDWIDKGPHQSHHLMERLSVAGHEIRVIDFEILWRKNKTEDLISKREVFENVHKAIDDGRITVIRPPIIRLPIIDYLSLLFTHAREIRKQLDEFRPDLIIGFGILNTSIAIFLARRRRIPFIYYIIDELHQLVPQKIFRRIAMNIERWNMEGSSLVLSINESLREYTVSMGARWEKTSVIRAGIDLTRFDHNIDGREIRNKLGIKDEDIVLFFMGWLYDFSGLFELSKELKNNIEEYHRIRLLIVGRGELWNSLAKMKAQEDLGDKLILLDWQPYDKIPEFISAADICILPAHKNEIMNNIVPIKIYEYMAMAKPVISTELPGMMKEFGDNNGVSFVMNAESVLVCALTLMNDERKLKENGSKARAFVEKNDWDKIVNDFEDALKRVISNGKIDHIHN